MAGFSLGGSTQFSNKITAVAFWQSYLIGQVLNQLSKDRQDKDLQPSHLYMQNCIEQKAEQVYMYDSTEAALPKLFVKQLL